MASGIFTLKQQLQGLIQGAWAGTSPSNAPKNVEYLVVAGGGAGGTDRAGGGGAGGLLQGILPITLGTSYTVTVGAGGTTTGGGTNPTGGNGVNSVFGNITAKAGGGGSGGDARYNGYQPASGGSGGGESTGDIGNLQGAQGTAGQGNAGGTSGPHSGNYNAAGGGGAGTVGLNAVGTISGNGGAGIASSISGTVTTYAGGGGGGTYGGTAGSGGLGGGGAGAAGTSAIAGTAGTANTGGGGGGGGGASGAGGAGGSGIVIVRYRGNVQFFSGGTLSYDSVNNYTVHTFYASGTLAPLATPVTYGTTSSLTKSLRFRASNSAYLSRTPASAGNQQKWTWSAWVKRGSLPAGGVPLFGAQSGPAFQYLCFGGSSLTALTTDALCLFSASGANYSVQSAGVYRDTSAWYHIVCAIDTAQATAANRTRLYVNGIEVSYGTSTYPAQNQNLFMNGNTSNLIGLSASVYFDGYMAEVNFIDGQQLTPLSFGQYDTTSGVWQPMTFVGTYGTNGFYLPFTNTTSTTTLGYDSSGNSNNWTTNNFSLTAGSTYDSMNDVPTLTSATASNYAVLNLNGTTGTTPITLSNGNLSFTYVTASNKSAYSTVGMTTGQFYFEAVYTTLGGTSNIGISLITQADPNNYCGSGSAQYSYEPSAKRSGGTPVTYGASWTTNDVIGVAFDATNGTITFYKNGASQGVAYTGIAAGTYVFGISVYNGSTGYVNFGQQPWQYSPPSGYVALNTYNLPTPTIVRGNQYMDATLYPGTGVAQTVMNAGSFQPDLVWSKNRTGTNPYGLFDSVRGSYQWLASNTTSAESTLSSLTSFNSNGFSLGVDFNGGAGASYVGWQWQAGKGTNSTNTNGSVTSTVSVSTTAGFSIVNWTPSAGNDTVGHGLGVAPSMIIAKPRTITTFWPVYHSALGPTKVVGLNQTDAQSNGATTWNSTSPTSTVFSTAAWFSNSGATIAYCFAQIAGFSAFGSYTGNGSTDGPFVYTGFRPKFVLWKNSSSVFDWQIVDTSRDVYNASGIVLQPNATNTEGDGRPQLDILSNGFKIRASSSVTNESGSTIIYAAFAENPFKYSNAR